jgi:hypothetical protein
MSASYGVEDLRELIAGTVNTDPGLIFRGGHYEVNLVINSLSVGYGVRLEYADDSPAYTPVSYGSLQTTGFEIVGGIKVVCRVDVTLGYPSNALPCPRGTLYRIWASSEGPVTIPVGTMVGGREGGSGPADDQVVGEAVASSSGPPADIVGVTLTDTLVPSNVPSPDAWGWVLVASDGVVMVQRDSATAGATLVTGHPVYLSDLGPTVGGSLGAFALEPVNGASYLVGVVAPVGPRNADGPIAIVWTYDRPQTQLYISSAALTKTNDVAMEDIPDLLAPLESGKTYQVEAWVKMAAGAVGGVALGVYITSSIFYTSEVEIRSSIPAPGLALDASGNVNTPSGVSGPTFAFGTIRALLLSNAAQTLSIKFAQNVSDGAPSIAYEHSWMRVTEQ